MKIRPKTYYYLFLLASSLLIIKLKWPTKTVWNEEAVQLTILALPGSVHGELVFSEFVNSSQCDNEPLLVQRHERSVPRIKKVKSQTWKQISGKIPKPGAKGLKVITKGVKGGLLLSTGLTSGFVGTLLGNLLNFILLTYPTWLTVPPLIGATLLSGIILGRLIQIRLTPTMPTTTTTTAATTTTSTTTTTTTTTPAPVGPGGTADFFGGTNLSGPGIRLMAPIGTCVDVPPPADNQFQSIDTKNNCVVVCDLAGCGGTCITYMSAGIVGDLGSFNLMISSIRFC